MFRLNCCNGSRKARVFKLNPEKHYKEVYLKTAVCSKCKQYVVVLEMVDYNGKTKRVKKKGMDAVIFFANKKCNILYEMRIIKTSAPKIAWTYGKIINATTQVRRYMDESGNAGEKFKCPVKVVA